MPDPRLRVLAVASHPVQYSAPLFRLLAQHPQLDFHVAYCSLRGAERGHDPEFGRDVQWDVPLLDGYQWTHIPNRGSGKESFFGLYNPGLWSFVRAGHFDAVLCYTGYPRASFWITYFASKLSGTAFLFGTDAITLAARDGSKWKVFAKRLVWPFLFRLADQVIAPSTRTRELMLSLGIRHERITLTPYVVHNAWWLAQSSRVDRAAVRQTWGAAGQIVILFCAKLQPWKRPLDLLEAFANASLPRALLVFAGEGPLRSALESRAASIGVSDRLRFLGFANQTELPAVYTAADLLVLPSEYDPFGVVVNEAMLCGCPVVASDCVGAARDLIKPGKTGFIYPCGDLSALAQILRQAAAGAISLSDMGRAARENMGHWSPAHNVEATVAAVARASSKFSRQRAPSTPAPVSATASHARSDREIAE